MEVNNKRVFSLRSLIIPGVVVLLLTSGTLYYLYRWVPFSEARKAFLRLNEISMQKQACLGCDVTQGQVEVFTENLKVLNKGIEEFGNLIPSSNLTEYNWNSMLYDMHFRNFRANRNYVPIAIADDVFQSGGERYAVQAFQDYLLTLQYKNPGYFQEPGGLVQKIEPRIALVFCLGMLQERSLALRTGSLEQKPSITTFVIKIGGEELRYVYTLAVKKGGNDKVGLKILKSSKGQLISLIELEGFDYSKQKVTAEADALWQKVRGDGNIGTAAGLVYEGYMALREQYKFLKE